ncbi:site-specific DNA-methyltransferase [Azonexus caeni]|uniref:site-specific DNA-methyltransferase n=1 Tax=Azonexus caeni TaxID=266126 RepID=UPI003A8463C2
MPLLDWLNKNQALRTAGRVPFRLLETVSAHGDVGGASNDNWLIRGDNLEALKALLPFFAGRVKCIYIDPPYNTRSAFEHYDDNLEHSQWLSMIYPRLELLRELLAEDGSIWVSIDDNEAHYLKVVMDEVFGRGNFVANVVWQKKYAVANDHKTIAPMHDHILVFQKSAAWKRNLLPRTDEKDRQYKFEDDAGVFRASDYTCNKTFEERPNLYYPILQPNTGKEIWPSKTRVWAYSREEHQRHVAEGFIYWGKDGKGNTPSFKRYRHLLKNDGVVPQTLWQHEFAGHTDGSRKEVREVLGSQSLADDFITPKPELLISRVLQVATNPGDLVLDSFLGSGTTAAVAHKMGRRWIGIEMGEHAETHCLPRLQKVVAGEAGGISAAVGWTGGGGFRFFRLGEAVFEADGRINAAIRFPTLAAWVWYQETRTPWSMPPLGIEPTPLLGSHDGTAYFLLYNGILGDRRPQGGNVLTGPILALLDALAPPTGPRVIYGESCRLSPPRLKAAGIVFKQIPYDIRAR